jgi:cell division septation protein DedD
VFLTTIVAVWLAWQAVSPSPPKLPELDLPGSQAKSTPEVEKSPDGTLVEAAPAPGSTSRGPAQEDGETTPARGVELPYSVLVASYVRWEDALERSSTLESEGDMAFVAPTVIGERVYFRVLAGAVEDRLQAADLMRSLVDKNSKERERAWDMRPVALAFVLGDFASEDAADAERDRLHESGLPAYVLEVDAPGGVSYRLYSGAFESEAAAAALDSMLAAAGRPSTLETRRGVAR